MPSDVVHLLQNLIRIPSVNPDNDPGTDQTGEAAMADYVQEFLETIGYQVTQEEILPERPNVIARIPGDETRPRILLGPHLDTVTVKGMSIDPFSGDLRDGKIWGRGASDTKGPMAAMLQALARCKDHLETLPVAIDFVGFMGEEASQHGSKHFAQHHAKNYDFALVGEPTSLNAVHVTKGALWATIVCEGKSAHASQPQLGDNAIMKLSSVLDRINRKLTARLATYTHPVLGHSTLNVGTIQGGSIPNAVPNHAQAQLDIRFTPDLASESGASGLLKSFLEEHQLPATITRQIENPPMEVASDHPWLVRILNANPETKLVGAPWFSDAAHLNAAGLPSICIGPGSIDQAHTKDEFINVSDLEDGADYFERLILSMKA